MEHKGKGIAKVVFSLLLLAGLVYVAIFGIPDGKGHVSGNLGSIKQGLDLAGGVSITYEALKAAPTTQEMSDTIARLQTKADSYSSEAEVYQEGTNRINIDIPDVTDANAILKELGQLGQLKIVELRTDENGNEEEYVWLTGDDVQTAQAKITQNQTTGQREYLVELTLKSEGISKFAEATEKNVGKILYIMYDNKVISSPKVNEKISSPTCVITGMADMAEAEKLAEGIRNGALPLELQEVRSNVVGARLGSDAIRTSLIAGAIGLGIVILFMICFYRIPGLSASLALLIYTGMMIMVLSAFQVTMTLSGIAGIILSVGMAVDANVIIFARIREEIGAGKTVKTAIEQGFGKAFSAILDGNITTLIAAFVLYFLCSGTIKGFAITLAIGIILSMISSLVITRMILTGFYAIGARSEALYGKTVEKKAIPFCNCKKFSFSISIALIAVGIIAAGIFAFKGSALNYSLEFVGGTSTNVTMKEAMDIATIENEVKPVVVEATGVSNATFTTVAGTTEIIIKTTSLDLEQRTALATALKDKFGVVEDDIKTENISATIGTEMRRDALIAVTVAIVLILIYIWIRFKDIRFGASAVLALAHDVLIVIGAYAVLRWSVGNAFIACILTIVGYSINNTIVIFDRIRENLVEKKDKETMESLVDRSVTQCLSRSINTSLTTTVMVLVLLIVGVSSIREFALPLLVGMICGTYSSVFIAGPLWLVLRKLIKAEGDNN
ncbi:MAG: protein translocase subunit SecD [Lachnospiraceae bacterium]|nr:protein translocase subunit SecD [Lachnospiraceae bacterium]